MPKILREMTASVTGTENAQDDSGVTYTIRKLGSIFESIAMVQKSTTAN